MVKEKTCPNCGGEGDIEDTFGWRKVGIKRRIPQSWCRACRAEERKATPIAQMHPRPRYVPVNLPEDRADLKELYSRFYASDTAPRSIAFMRRKLNARRERDACKVC